ncbi:MAG: AlpA family phage regulatory protein [Limnohabitans sp.]
MRRGDFPQSINIGRRAVAWSAQTLICGSIAALSPPHIAKLAHSPPIARLTWGGCSSPLIVIPPLRGCFQKNPLVNEG